MAESYWVTMSCVEKIVFFAEKSGGGGVKIFLESCVSYWESTKDFFGLCAAKRNYRWNPVDTEHHIQN